jgi:hypothetical protein
MVKPYFKHRTIKILPRALVASMVYLKYIFTCVSILNDEQVRTKL